MLLVGSGLLADELRPLGFELRSVHLMAPSRLALGEKGARAHAGDRASPA